MISGHVNDESPQPIRLICQNCPNLLHLQLYSYGGDCGDEVIKYAVRYCRSIQSLPTDTWSYTNTAVKAIATINTLTKLHLKRSARCSTVQLVLISNLSLIDLSLSGPCINDSLVSCIGKYCGNLTSLKLLRDEDATPLNEQIIQTLFIHCNQLKVLHLYFMSNKLSNTALRILFQHCRYITDLVFDARSPCIDEDIVLYDTYTTLTTFYHHFSGLSDAALLYIFTYCTNLVKVDLYGVY